MVNFNENAIKEAAYYIWQNAGCPQGQDEVFWSMAIEQLSSQKPATCKKSASAKSSTCKSASCKSTTAKKTVAKKAAPKKTAKK